MTDVRAVSTIALSRTAEWLRRNEVEIMNEAGLLHAFYFNLVVAADDSSVSVRRIHTEIKFKDPKRPQVSVAMSIDLGITSETEAASCYDLLLEAKVWIRPNRLSGFTANSSTSKRKQSVRDGMRLVRLMREQRCREAAVLIFERGSAHLRNNVPKELQTNGIRVEESWFEIRRPGLERCMEHIGVLWLSTIPPASSLV